jgi:hypothetical protein
VDRLDADAISVLALESTNPPTPGRQKKHSVRAARSSRVVAWRIVMRAILHRGVSNTY